MSETLFRGRKFSVERRTVELPDGRRPTVELMVHNGAVVILPLASADEVLLIRQFRPAAGDWLLELPAGTLEPGEDPAVCAARELEEETGHRAASLAKLAEFFPAPGVSTERMHAFVATGLTPTRQRLEDYELLTVRPTPIAEALRMAAAGEIRDAKTLAVLLMWKARNP